MFETISRGGSNFTQVLDLCRASAKIQDAAVLTRSSISSTTKIYSHCPLPEKGESAGSWQAAKSRDTHNGSGIFMENLVDPDKQAAELGYCGLA